LSYFNYSAYTYEGIRISGENILQAKVHQGQLRAEGFRYAIVASRWNEFLTARLIEGAIDALERLGADENSIEVFRVPGSFEIPMLTRKIADSKRFDAVICLGTILRGQTPHFDFVAGEATSGIARVAADTGILFYTVLLRLTRLSKQSIEPVLKPATKDLMPRMQPSKW
jgi:6,7-dimethyl-8-ribityllumazine synthase